MIAFTSRHVGQRHTTQTEIDSQAVKSNYHPNVGRNSFLFYGGLTSLKLSVGRLVLTSPGSSDFRSACSHHLGSLGRCLFVCI